MKSSFECLETWFKKYTYLYNNNSDKNNKNKNNSNNNNKVSIYTNSERNNSEVSVVTPNEELILVNSFYIDKKCVPFLILHVFLQAYTFKVSKGMYERIKVDANKKSETFSLSVASSGKKEGDYVYDFNKVSN